MPDPIQVTITTGQRSATLGDEDHRVFLGGMTAFEFTRFAVTEGSVQGWEPRITTPAYDGRTTVNLGGGDDFITNSSGDDVLDGGTGLDMMSFAAETFFARSNWEIGDPYPVYFVDINLTTQTAFWLGRDIVEVRNEPRFDIETGDGGPSVEYRFSLSNFGGFSHSITDFEIIKATEGNDRITGSDAPLEIFDLGLGGRDTLNAGGGVDLLTLGFLSSVLFEDGTAARIDLDAGTLQLRHFRSGFVVETTQITGVENVYGSAGNDTIVGDDEDKGWMAAGALIRWMAGQAMTR